MRTTFQFGGVEVGFGSVVDVTVAFDGDGPVNVHEVDRLEANGRRPRLPFAAGACVCGGVWKFAAGDVFGVHGFDDAGRDACVAGPGGVAFQARGERYAGEVFDGQLGACDGGECRPLPGCALAEVRVINHDVKAGPEECAHEVRCGLGDHGFGVLRRGLGVDVDHAAQRVTVDSPARCRGFRDPLLGPRGFARSWQATGDDQFRHWWSPW